MKVGQRIRITATGAKGTVHSRTTAVGRLRVLFDDGEIRWVRKDACEAICGRPNAKHKNASLAAAAKRLGKSPDDICHLATMNGLTIEEAIEALS